MIKSRYHDANRTIALFIMGLAIIWCVSGCAANHDPFIPVTYGHDTDKDSLSDAMEMEYGTDINNPDTDADGLKDGIEVALGIDPRNPDSDGDGEQDADDFLPDFNNAHLYIIIALSNTLLVTIFGIIIHLRSGISRKRKLKLQAAKEVSDNQNADFKTAQETILDLAKEKYGWLSLEESASQLSLDVALVEDYFKKMGAKKKDGLYMFPDIVKLTEK